MVVLINGVVLPPITYHLICIIKKKFKFQFDANIRHYNAKKKLRTEETTKVIVMSDNYEELEIKMNDEPLVPHYNK